MSQSEPSVLFERTVAHQYKSTPGRTELELANSNSALRFVWNSECSLALGVKVIHKEHQSKLACMPAQTPIYTHIHTDPRLFVYRCCHLCLLILGRAHSGTGYGD